MCVNPLIRDAAEEIVIMSVTTCNPEKSKDPHKTGENVHAATPLSFLRHTPYTYVD